MKKQKLLLQAFDNKEYMHSREGRIIRVMAEFSEPKNRFEKLGIIDTVAFFGSARTLALKEAKKQLLQLKKNPKTPTRKLKKAGAAVEMARYCDDARKLAKQLSLWLKERTNTFAICSGGGPGIMEAANRGAREAGFPSIGLNINLPLEQQPNPYITPDLNFEFHYFFLRKFWFLYLAKALVVFPGGFGTLDEMMEVLTLVQTEKIQKELTIVLYGKQYWKKVINFDYLIESGVIDEKDMRIFHFSDTVEDALKYITGNVNKLLKKRKRAGHQYERPLVVGF